jgi:hypothetical protein
MFGFYEVDGQKFSRRGTRLIYEDHQTKNPSLPTWPDFEFLKPWDWIGLSEGSDITEAHYAESRVLSQMSFHLGYLRTNVQDDLLSRRFLEARGAVFTNLWIRLAINVHLDTSFPRKTMDLDYDLMLATVLVLFVVISLIFSHGRAPTTAEMAYRHE